MYGLSLTKRSFKDGLLISKERIMFVGLFLKLHSRYLARPMETYRNSTREKQFLRVCKLFGLIAVSFKRFGMTLYLIRGLIMWEILPHLAGKGHSPRSYYYGETIVQMNLRLYEKTSSHSLDKS